MRKSIVVTDLEVVDDRLRVRIDYSKDLANCFLNDTFQAEYGTDISDVDRSILYIPVISSLITVAWAVGADISVETLDTRYLKSLSEIRSVFEKWFPQFSCSTVLDVGKIVPSDSGGEQYGMLFSGGVDSLTSYLRHRNRQPELITIWGADIALNERQFWERIRKRIVAFSKEEGVNAHFVKTNMRQLLNEYLLARRFGLRDWWGVVAHGLMLLGLCAPLTLERNMGTLLIAATHTQEFREPWGSHPLVDERVKWAGVGVVHDGYQMSRQEKIGYLTQHSEYLPYLRVCYSSRTDYNCGHCEKCMRTMTALILEGEDPLDSAFKGPVNEEYFRRLKEQFLRGRMHLGKDELFMWRDIQKHIPPKIGDDLRGSRDFFRWFKDFDLSRYRNNEFYGFIKKVSGRITGGDYIKTLRKLLYSLNYFIRSKVR